MLLVPNSWGRPLTEAWSDAARQAAIAARRARSQQAGDAFRTAAERAGKRKAEKAKAAKAGAAGASAAKKEEAEKKKGEAAIKRAENEKKAAARKAEADVKRASAEQRAKVAAGFDAKLKALAAQLASMRGNKSSPAYAKAYAAYQALGEEKQIALGGSHRVEAPEKKQAAKAPTRRRAVVPRRRPQENYVRR